MDTYIVRIYRREEAGRQRLVGAVEEVGVEGQRSFATLRELWKILASPADRSPKKPRSPSPRRACR